MCDPPIDRVVIINDRSAMVGGASNLSILLADGLETLGIRTTFFAGDTASGNGPVADTINLGMPAVTEQTKPNALVRGLYNHAAYKHLLSLIKERDTARTIYHVHGWSKILSPSIFQALKRVRSRTILHAHDYFLACPNGGFANFQTSSACNLRPMSLECLKTQCDKRSAAQKYWRVIRHALRENLFPIQNEPANIILIHEGMNKYFQLSGIPTQLAKTIRNPIEPFVSTPTEPWLNNRFYFVGRLEPEKGFEDAAAAAKRAGVNLHFIGDGGGRELLEKSFPDFLVHGWKTKEAMRPLLNQARAVVISSRVPEPYGLAAVEAIASGIPVIMPDSALLSDEVKKFSCGLVYRSGDTSALASVMSVVANEDDSIKKMSANGPLCSSQIGTSFKTWISSIADLYKEVLANSHG